MIQLSNCAPLALLMALPLALAGPADAGTRVQVTVVGTVGFNQISGAPLQGVQSGDQAVLRFQVDSDVFVDSPNFPTRGYVIDPTSFSLRFDGSIVVGLQNPFPPGQTPYFVLRDNDPAVDGFFVATSFDFPVGVPISQTGLFGQFVNNTSVTYDGTTLGSLDVLEAVGMYDFTGLQVFGWAIEDGPFSAMDITFQGLRIEVPVQTYCTAGTSANGCQAAIAASGAASATATSGFTLSATGAEGAKQGLFFFGANGRQANPWGNGTSFQCVTPPVKRGTNTAGGGTPGACDGTFAEDLNALWCPSCPKPALNPGSGAVVQAQLWYRDPTNTSNQTTSLSDAVEFSIAP